MILLWYLLWQVAIVLAVGFSLLLGWAVYYHFSTTEVPPGICQPHKVRIVHIMGTLGFAVGYLLWKMGLCGEFTILRLLINGIPPMKDPRLSIQDTHFENIPVRVYRPQTPSPRKRKGILFFHGGTGTMGSLDSFERPCRYFACKSDAVVVSVGYHLAPEHQYPVQYKQCLSAAEFFLKTAEDHGVDSAQIAIAGDSIGGTIAAFVVQELVQRPDLPRPRAQVLISPLTQCIDLNLPSYQQNRHIPIVSQRVFLQFASFYLTSNRSVLDFMLKGHFVPEDKKAKFQGWLNSESIPKELVMRGGSAEFPPSKELSDNVFTIRKWLTETKLSPLLAEDEVIRKLPETFILTCQFDVLRDDGLLYKKRLEDNGIHVAWCHLKDGFHGMLLFFNHWFVAFPFAARGVDNIVDFIKSL